MAETKIIPLELKALICSHLLSSYNRHYFKYFNMAPYDRHSLAGVTPLDIPDVRKTQRRVAALLGRDPGDIFPTRPCHRYRHGAPPYTDSDVHSIRRLLGARKGHHGEPVLIPPAPQNSWLGFNSGHDDNDHHKNADDHDDDDDDDNVGNYDDYNDDEDDANLFDTSIFHDDTDPNGFKLPPVFAGVPQPGGSLGVWSKHNRVVPTVSERTFIDSNLRHKGYNTDRGGGRSGGSTDHRHHHHSPSHHTTTSISATTASSSSSSSTTTSTYLPPINPQQNHNNLVSMKMEHDEDNRINNNNDNTTKQNKKRERAAKKGVVNDNDDDREVDDDGIGGRGILENDQKMMMMTMTSSKEEEMELVSSMVRMITLESELTRAGSLLMDENFVPMSVTITKLSQEGSDRTDRGCDWPEGISNDKAGRTSKSKGRKNHNPDGSTGTCSSPIKSSLKDSSYCSCKEPTPLLVPSTSPCPCCLRIGSQHETGCPQKGANLNTKREATLSCNLCGKLIVNNSNRKRKEKSGGGGKRQKDDSNRKLSGSGYTRNPTTPETAIHRFQSHDSPDFYHRQKCSSGNGSDRGGGRGGELSGERRLRRSSSSKTRLDDPSTADHRVRFDENVTTRHIPYTDDVIDEQRHDLPNHEEDENDLSENERKQVQESSKKHKNKKLFVKRKDFRFPKIGQSVNIPNLGVSVHAMAYDLALKDARIEAENVKKKRRPKSFQGTQFGEFSGTMFSYFPLLKRPLSEFEIISDIGLRAQEGRKVTGKNYKNMRHIFGNVNIADYYPGGKKWRKI